MKNVLKMAAITLSVAAAEPAGTTAPSRNSFLQMVAAPPAPKPPNESFPWSLQDAAARGKTEILKMVLKLGADVNATGTKGNTALELACRNGKADAVKVLLDHGADVRLRTTAGTTMMHEAALGDSAAVIVMLREKGADMNATDAESGATPLHFAASFGRVNAVRALLEKGADAKRKNNKNMTPLQAAIFNGQGDAAAVLRSVK